MNNPNRVLVILPAYNEAESILSSVKAVIDAGYDYVVVNDGSTDNTLEVCRVSHIMYLIFLRILVSVGLFKPAISTQKNMGTTLTSRSMAMGSMTLLIFPKWLSRLTLAMTW